MRNQANYLKAEAIKSCRKLCPTNVTAREYFEAYIVGCYPYQYDSYAERYVENEFIYIDFGMYLDQLAERLAKIYYKLFIPAIITNKEVEQPKQLNLF